MAQIFLVFGAFWSFDSCSTLLSDHRQLRTRRGNINKRGTLAPQRLVLTKQHCCLTIWNNWLRRQIVSDDKIQIILLILGRGALSTSQCCSIDSSKRGSSVLFPLDPFQSGNGTFHIISCFPQRGTHQMRNKNVWSLFCIDTSKRGSSVLPSFRYLTTPLQSENKTFPHHFFFLKG